MAKKLKSKIFLDYFLRITAYFLNAFGFLGRWNKFPLLAIFASHIIDYPTPKNLNYLWSFGSGASICLGIQMLTGIFLAMHYCPKMDYAFYSIEHIMRNVQYGWLIRYIHANGASMFFITVYSHMFRGLFFGSYIYPRHLLWMSGVIIFLLMMATAFMGYVLPWGQMSFWGATVITNLFSTIPFVGTDIVEWLWGGFSVDNPTLNRFFSIHYTLPFVIAAFVIIHLALLHDVGSSNPLGVEYFGDKISFYPYFYVKDLFSFFILIFVFSIFLYFFPNFLNHPDNYIPADSISTPAHIVPEWYFLPFYAILRSIPHKLGGVLAMGGAIIILLLLPFINFSSIRSSFFRPFFNVVFGLIFLNFIFLGWLGQQPVHEPFILAGMISTFLYFFFFLIVLPLLGFIESKFVEI